MHKIKDDSCFILNVEICWTKVSLFNIGEDHNAFSRMLCFCNYVLCLCCSVITLLVEDGANRCAGCLLPCLPIGFHVLPLFLLVAEVSCDL